jgi:hypothetical protein
MSKCSSGCMAFPFPRVVAGAPCPADASQCLRPETRPWPIRAAVAWRVTSSPTPPRKLTEEATYKYSHTSTATRPKKELYRDRLGGLPLSFGFKILVSCATYRDLHRAALALDRHGTPPFKVQPPFCDH